MRIAWWGDSLIEAYEAHNLHLADPADLPPVGSTVEITQWRHRGFAYATTIALQARHPSVEVESVNFAIGGATSADVLTEVRAEATGQKWHVAEVGCGTNDVWRRFQQRPEGVPIDAYEANMRAALRALEPRARALAVIAAPPIGWLPGIDTAAVNAELARYNERTRRAALDVEACYIDAWDRFLATATALGWATDVPAAAEASATLWRADGVHLSALGDHLLAEEIVGCLTEAAVLEPRIEP
ncbi:SGNH/GDSL hydrolase family protein [Nocardia asiatica]|uniref:SGNH/GDSL hydrolase family protein n=1 Tax=Nocardia asiatica TaxID=209252 RepID=UPI0024591082|nr:SGNH/GDSL hydrolase family protein [Nocardia asiatica]